MAVNPESFYEEEVEAIINSGNKLLGSNFRIKVDGCEELSKMVVTCNPALPGRHLVEGIVGGQGVEVREPGPLKTGGQFTMTFHDGFKGQAFDEITQWALDSVDVTKRKTVWIWGSHELGNSNLDMAYSHCFPELEDGSFDHANRTAPAKFSFILHFSNRKWTKIEKTFSGDSYF